MGDYLHYFKIYTRTLFVDISVPFTLDATRWNITECDEREIGSKWTVGMVLNVTMKSFIIV